MSSLNKKNKKNRTYYITSWASHVDHRKKVHTNQIIEYQTKSFIKLLTYEKL